MEKTDTSKQSAGKQVGVSTIQFAGFQPPTANFIYCPNQFFDVCLSCCSRNVVRLVGYFLLRTLGWLDRQGQPIEQEIKVTYAELIADAGISRGAIRPAIDDAIQAGFIACKQPARAKSADHPGQSARYMLRWDDGDRYTSELSAFGGFYSGDGHRTPIPEVFFSRVVRHERHAVVKVVGTVLRHTVGYQNQFGGRRSEAPLSYDYIQRYANLRDRSTLSIAIQQAMNTGYICRISTGHFAASAAKRKAASYAVNWLTDGETNPIGSIIRPASINQSKKPTSNGSKKRPADRFRNPTKEKTTKKNTSKQQYVVENLEGFRLLTEFGFDETTAARIAEKRGLSEIQQQIAWLPERKPRDNKLGMLRRAIEENWSKPVTIEQKDKQRHLIEKMQQQTEQEKIEETEIVRRKREQKRLREAALHHFNNMREGERAEIEQAAFAFQNSDFFRQRFQTCEEFRVKGCLDEICRREGAAITKMSQEEPLRERSHHRT